MIRFDNVCFAYEGKNWAVENINFTIKPGEFVALVGSNGSGKSTIARLTDGLLLPQNGEVIVDNINSKNDSNTLKAKVGLVFQNPDDQFVGATVEEDLAFGLENMSVSPKDARERIRRVADILQITEYLNSSPSMLSGGEKQKAAIAAVLVMQPNYLVLDEITALLDPIARKEILKFVYGFSKDNNIGVLYITHLTNEALIADKVILLSGGKIAKEGKPKEVLSDIDFLNGIGVEVPLPIYISGKLRDAGITNELICSEEKLINMI